MKEPMHILIIPSWYPQFSGDVGGSFFREQAIALKKVGYSVGVISPQVRSLKHIKNILKKPYGLTRENDEGIYTLRWYTANYFPKAKNYNKNRWMRIALKLFETYVEQHGKPDIIHVHSMWYAGFAALLIYEKYGIPYVITEHSSAFARNLIPQEGVDSLKSVVKQAKARIAVSQKFSNYLETQFPSNHWLYIPNIVNDDFFTLPKAVENTDLSSKIRIISICHLNKNKNTELLIKAFALVLERDVDLNLELVIGGDGEERKTLQKLVESLGLKNHVQFLGSLTRNQVKQEINQSSIFVVSSKYETFGVVVVEALALGKPVVSTQCGGPESIINKDVGVLVENDSVSELAKGILHVSTHLNDYDADTLRTYCLENFSEKAVINRLTNIYHGYGI
ncbi:glycosyltransferase [Acinetobacter pseudolwoffii]|uniref:glycosyltransferase n=1 Tax=Acinetobacter pseudolwoffii TaxID=2053287 RepID=UPI000C238D1D|nr:glycosyltransferase [Acinetobacter pseudolwoffii]PJI29648.1 glycosyltransferase family 4 protein [Acinetobacter pseudolwoffii]